MSSAISILIVYKTTYIRCTSVLTSAWLMKKYVTMPHLTYNLREIFYLSDEERVPRLRIIHMSSITRSVTFPFLQFQRIPSFCTWTKIENIWTWKLWHLLKQCHFCSNKISQVQHIGEELWCSIESTFNIHFNWTKI